ncbi:MAG: ATPase, T2SS/T4P/T4SS family [Candidatus Omnitrophota bacterium]
MPEEIHQQRLGDLLITRGIITQTQLDKALQEQKISGRFIGEVLVSQGAASEEQIAQSLSEQLGLAFVDLFTITIEPAVIELIAEELCVKHTAMPLFAVQNTLTLAMANPLDINAIDEFQAAGNCRVRPVFACPTAIRNAIDKHYHRTDQEEANKLAAPFTPDKAEPAGQAPAKANGEQIASLRQAASLAPVVDMVNSIVTRAVEMGASDIHLEPETDSFNCRYRIDGIMYPTSQIPSEDQAAVISRIKIMASLDISEKRLPQDGRIRMFAAGREIDLRVSTFPSIHGENVVIRILDRSGGVLKLEQLGFYPKMLADFSKLISRPYGIILVTGPTGSGKTTTLYAALTEINTREKNIITLEDPVEYEIEHIHQCQVNVKSGLTFATGLRSIVRQDPDIIMIGEIRDKETADIAIHSALTGHLVFSTLHTNNAPSAAARLIDMGVEPYLIASSLLGVLAQRLVRTLCDQCKKEYVPSKELLTQLGLSPASVTNEKLLFYKEVGCRKCKQRGYSGRKGIYELLIPDDALRELITGKSSATVLKDAAMQRGMKSLRDSGLEKISAGITSVSEILRVTEEM